MINTIDIEGIRKKENTLNVTWSFHILLQLRPWKWYKDSKEDCSFKKIYYSWFSSVHPENSTNSITRWHSSLNNKTLAEIEGHCKWLECQEKKLKEAAKSEKHEKYKCMKRGPAENMTLAVLKELLKDKGMAFSSKAKKKELVDLFIATHHTSGRPIVAAWKWECQLQCCHVVQLPTTAVFQRSSSFSFEINSYRRK